MAPRKPPIDTCNTLTHTGDTMEPYAAGDDDGDEEHDEEYEHSGLGPPSTTRDVGTGAAAVAGKGGGVDDDIKAVYAHVDLDAFYAQVERSLDPSLVGIPLGGNEAIAGGGGDGCICC